MTRDHVKKYMDIKAYYMDITTNNIATIKKLKNEIAGYQKCKWPRGTDIIIRIIRI